MIINKTKKVLLILPSTERGGAEESALVLSQALKAKGFSIIAVLPMASGLRGLGDDFAKFGISVFFRPILYNHRILKTLLAIVSLTLVYFVHRPQTILIIMPEFLTAAHLVRILSWFKCQKIYSFRCEPLRSQAINVRHKLHYQHWFQGTNLVALSLSMRDKLVCFFDIPAHQISVIRNAVLPLSQQGQQYLKTLSKVQVRRELRVPESIYLVLFAGRLNPSKGFLDLFHAMKTVVADDNDVHLFVAGGGEGYFHAKEFVDVNHLEANIHLLGYRSDIPLLLKAADLLVLPSYAEGVPRILLEAFEIGTPVLVSDIPSLKEVVQHGKSGGVFELGSTADICRSILAAKRSRIKTETWVANASKKLKSHNYCQMVNEYVRLIED